MRLLEEAREDNPAAESIVRCNEMAKGYRLGQSAFGASIAGGTG